MRFLAIGTIFYLGLTASVSAADEKDKTEKGPKHALGGVVVLGAVSVPEFEGSSDQTFSPFIGARIQFDRRYLALEGTEFRANLSKRSGFEVGPVLNVVPGRDSSVTNAAVSRLEEVDNAIELGLFVTKSWQGLGNHNGQASLALQSARDVSTGHGGRQATLSAEYSGALNPRWQLGMSLSATLANKDYADTYFSVSSADALASGLPAYTAKGGLKDLGLGVNTNYAMSRNWIVTGFVNYNRLMGDFADSPIVDLEGNSNQIIAGLGLGYAF